MIAKNTCIALVVFWFATSTCVFADDRQRISIQVVDEQAKPVEGATVAARYLKTVQQIGKDYPVPMELTPSQTTDANGCCELTLGDVDWSLAGLEAHRVELTTEEAMKLCDDAPRAPVEREAFDRELNDRCQRFGSAYQVLTPNTDLDELVTLELAKAIKVTGRVRVDGRPLEEAFVTIHSRKTQVDQLFARSAPELTDHEGRFSFYTVPGDLDRARVIAERSSGIHVLTLADVPSKRTSTGFHFELDTVAKHYTLEKRP